MATIEKTVFISYRRTDFPWALAVYQNLTAKGYDVFFDVTSISSGDFEQIIIGNIKARAHFLVILTPSALERCNEPGDWLRREIEIAIHEKRNIIPLFFNGFSFGTPSISKKLTGNLANVKKYNGLEVPVTFFAEAMERLVDKYLNVELNTVLHPVSNDVRKVVEQQQVAANKISQEADKLFADAQKAELFGEFAKALNLFYEIRRIDPLYPRIDAKIGRLEDELRKIQEKKERREEKERKRRELFNRFYKSILQTPHNWNLIILRLAIFVILIGLIIFIGKFITENPNRKPITMISPKDGMVMVYVQAGDFPMGSTNGDNDEKPVHTVYLDNFWIDQIEVTNSMYAKCVLSRECTPPHSDSSSGYNSYFGNPKFDNYPVIYVSWDDASRYCAWVDRRLPTEAEWEKAAAWDEETQSKFIYPWGNSFDERRSNFCDKNCVFGWSNKTVDDGFADTAPVGSYPAGASPYGVYDMAGNVWEWIADWYSETYYSSSPSINPSGPDSGEFRVLRGGAWLNLASYLRSSDRYWSDPNLYNYDFGFRCAIGTQ